MAGIEIRESVVITDVVELGQDVVGVDENSNVVEIVLDSVPDIVEVGTSGPPGSDGRTILNGTGVPDPSLGVEGDFYVDTTPPLTMYGPRVSGVWGVGVPLLPSDYVTSVTVREIVALTQAAYDAMGSHDPDVMYAILP